MRLHSKYLYTYFTWQRMNSRSETVDIQYYATVGWPDRCCFLRTSTHNISSIPPLIYSTAAALALFPNNQDRTHNYSWQTQAVQSPPAHSLQWCTWCTAWLPVETSGKAADQAHGFVQSSAKFLCQAIGSVMHFEILWRFSERLFCHSQRLKLALAR